MKRLISIVMVVILSITLFSGCNLIPIKHDFSRYGVSFKIAGTVTEKDGNEYGKAAFRTTLGTLQFQRYYEVFSDSLLNADNIIAFAAAKHDATPRTLNNGASYFFCEDGTNSAGDKLITLAYAIQVGSAVWLIGCTTTEANFDREAIIDVCLSAEFC